MSGQILELIFLQLGKTLRMTRKVWFVGVVLLVTSVEECTTQTLGLIYLLIYFGLNCEELTLRIRQLVLEQVSGTVRW